MSGALGSRTIGAMPGPPGMMSNPPAGSPMLTPANAWRIMCSRTGGAVSRATFYRWVASGRVFSIRVGHKFFIPWPALDEAIKQCLAGEHI